ncbi:Cytochrome P450-pinF1, plant-inducible [Methylobacterium crusticola]|uniref:Cytochrome P450-pinF1, plant-inducible n=1 Tax=Methylobacterium crusticola TaxID=1697972 RepID=A0ABQ4QWC5_9HYPH|nr:cytochrome P450 [Methylobacterium crusticola]GJD49677.1 Cytochrome P450-pinF1, plant-inducible [Methylobacterium crusticola]
MDAGAPIVVPRAELEADPHGACRRYRPLAPFISADDGVLILLRARDVQRLVTDPRTRQVETEFARLRGVTAGPLFDFLERSMLLSNGEAHARRRAPMAPAFAFQMVRALRPRIRAIAEAILERHHGAGGMNLLADYAAALPARTIGAVLGLPDDDIPRFTGWVYRMARALSSSWTPADTPGIEEATRSLTDYVRDRLAERRRAPRDDFLTAFAQSAGDDGGERAAEAVAQVVSVVLAGSDTTRAALTIQVALLLAHPEQWRAVCADEGLVAGAVAEALRYEPSVGSFPRFTVEEIDIDGHVLPAQALVSFSTLSALRDPDLYADPDRFDIRRADHPRWHLVFGGGAHRCLGEALARMELEEGLRALTRRVPGLRTAAPLRVEAFGGIRRVAELPVTWA